MFKKIRELKDAYNQGVLDSLADNAYLMLVIMISLIYQLKNLSKDHSEKLFKNIIEILYEFNPDFKKLDIPINDVRDIYLSYTPQLLQDVCASYKDVYTPGGESYMVLKSEYKLNEIQILNMKQEYKNQITSNLEKLYLLNSEIITVSYFTNHLNKIFSML